MRVSAPNWSNQVLRVERKELPQKLQEVLDDLQSQVDPNKSGHSGKNKSLWDKWLIELLRDKRLDKF